MATEKTMAFDWDALHIFNSLQASENPSDQERLIQLQSQLKNSLDGWQQCASIIVGGPVPSSLGNFINNNLKEQDIQQIKFFSCQVVEGFLKSNYSHCDSELKTTVRQFLSSVLTWLVHSPNGKEEPSFIRNKVAQLFAVVFVNDYPNEWPSFFKDLVGFINTTFSNSEEINFTTCSIAVDLFLSILLAIDEEVVSREIPRSPEELERNTKIKDFMRDNDVTILTEAWLCYLQLMIRFKNNRLIRLCLKVISLYISWIELTLIVNDKFIPVFMSLLATSTTDLSVKRKVCTCLAAISLKGMPRVNKMELIEFIFNQLSSYGVLQLDKCENKRLMMQPTEYLEKLGYLINTMGSQLISSLNKLPKEQYTLQLDPSVQAIEDKVDKALIFLSHEDDDVSNSVSQFIHDYVTVIKPLLSVDQQVFQPRPCPDNSSNFIPQLDSSENVAILPFTPERKQRIQNILSTTVAKLKYDESYNFNNEGELELEFQEYRKELRVIISNLAQLNPELVVSYTHTMLQSTLSDWRNTAVLDIEVALTLFYHLGEAIKLVKGDFFSKACCHKELMQNMMLMVVSSNVSYCNHPAVQIQYFELIVRYEKYFSINPHFIADAITSFLDHRGVQNTNSKVRARSAYLLSRFIRSHKNEVQPFTDAILSQISDLLTAVNIFRSLPISAQYSMCNSEFTDQINEMAYIFETAAQLIVSSTAHPDTKANQFRILHKPVLEFLPELIKYLNNESNWDHRIIEDLAHSVKSIIDLLSRTSRAFTPSQSMSSSGCVPVFNEAFAVLISSLESLSPHGQVRYILATGVRAFLHRMVICMDDSNNSNTDSKTQSVNPAATLLANLPYSVRLLIRQPPANCSSEQQFELCRDMRDLVPLVTQVLTRYKKRSLDFVCDVLPAFFPTILQILNMEVSDEQMDAMEEVKLLRRAYLQLLNTLIISLPEALCSIDSSLLQEVLHSVVNGCKDSVNSDDAQGVKLCFLIFRQLINAWGNDPAFYHQFILHQIVPSLFFTPTCPNFNLQDAQYHIALKECANCQKSLLQKQGDDFVNYLRHSYLPSLNLAVSVIEEFVNSLQGSQNEFQIYLNRFYTDVKTS